MQSFSRSSLKSGASRLASSRHLRIRGPKPPRRFPVGSQVEGPVTKLMTFGAFVQIADGIEGLVHVSEISADRRINHPQDVLRAGQVVKAQVLAIDTEKRQIRLSMKQLVPTSIDEYIAEHKVGDQVSGRVVEASPAHRRTRRRHSRRVPRHGFGGLQRQSRRALQQPRQTLSSLSVDAAGALEGECAHSGRSTGTIAGGPDPQLQDRQTRSGQQENRSRSGIDVIDRSRRYNTTASLHRARLIG